MVNVVETSDAANNAGTPYGLSAGDQFTGLLDTTVDRDWVRATLGANYGYYFILEGDGSANQLGARNLALWSETGSSLASSSSSGAVLLTINTSAARVVYADVGATRYSNDLGGYRVSLFQEVVNSAGTRENLAVGSSMTSAVDYEGDHDWVRIALDVNYGYYFTVEGDGSGEQLASRSLQLWSDAGNLIEANTGSGTVVAAINTNTDALIYADVSAPRYSLATGGYRLTAHQEIAGSAGTREALAVGASMTSAVEYSGDHDWVRIALDGNYGYYFTLEGDGSLQQLSSRSIQIWNDAGTSITSAVGSGAVVASVNTAGAAVIYADLSAARYSSATGGYQFSVQQEIAGSAGTRETLALGDTYTSRINYAGDHDWLRVALEAGQILRVVTTGAATNDPISGSQVVARTEGGEQIAASSRSSGANTLDFKASVTGDYYIDVASLNAGDYQVALMTGPWVGTSGADSLTGADFADFMQGMNGADRLEGLGGSDTLEGGDGADTLIGGAGDDFLYGGSSTGDVRDVIYGGDGNDSIDGGYGNDELRGDGGNDTVAGGFGADTVIGGAGDDVLTGSAYGDVIFGSEGNDFINGGFGFDRVNGGTGADKFFHLGVRDHGADWIQDYSAAEGDVLLFGGPANTAASDFLIQRASTANAGAAGVQEVFVTQISTGNLLWALVDGAGQTHINIQIGAQVFDLLA